MSKKSLTVFFSYSHKDELLRDELAKHLSLLQRDGTISAWHDRQISAGTEWANDIDANLNAADLILLLISSDFLASDYCHQVELKRAIDRHEKGEARVIPIILRPCRWQSAWFSKLQLLPKNGEPVTKWADRDDAFTNIVEGIERAIGEMLKVAAVPVAPPKPTVRNFVPVAELTSRLPSALTGSVPVPEVKKNLVELVSAKGIDYRELEKLLKAKEWRKADELTSKLMCQVSNREKEGWLNIENIKAFPHKDWWTIDQLWVHYSNSKFGFSIQKKLWLECGGNIWRYDDKVWKKFAAKIGWYYPQNDDWKTYTQLMNDTKNAQNAPLASLPFTLSIKKITFLEMFRSIKGDYGMGSWCLFSHEDPKSRRTRRGLGTSSTKSIDTIPPRKDFIPYSQTKEQDQYTPLSSQLFKREVIDSKTLLEPFVPEVKKNSAELVDTPPYDSKDIVSVYNYDPDLLRENLIETISQTKENIQARMLDDSIPLFLGKDNTRGDYWVVKGKQQRFMLVPKANFRLNQFSLETLIGIFELQDYYKGASKFQLIKPSSVASSQDGRLWHVEEMGILKFTA